MTLGNLVAHVFYNIVKSFTLRHITPDLFAERVEKFRTLLLMAGGARIGPNSVVRHDVMIKAPKNLVIHENVKIGEGARFYNFSKVTIGDNVEIGPELHVYTDEHIIDDYHKPLAKQGSRTREVHIGNDCYLGSRITILSGVTITDRCVVAAGSVVVRNLETSGVYAGVPAVLKKDFGE